MIERPEPGQPPEPAAPAADDQPSVAGSGGTSFRATLKGPDRLRIGLVVGGLLAIVVTATAALGASPPPSDGSSASTQPGAGGARSGGIPFAGRPFAGLADGARGALDRLSNQRFGQITITAISGSNISLKTEDGWTRTISVTTTTSITRAGQKIALGDLKVGDAVRFRQNRNADGSFSITELAVVVPRVAGTVTAASGSGFTITKRDGTTWTVTVSGSTAYTVGRLDRKAGSRADVKVGSEVVVEGTQSSGNALNAIAVHVTLPTVAGQVTAKTGNTITVRRPDGTSATIRVGSSTSYRVRGVATPTLASITVGMGIVAEGAQRSDGSLDATSVAAGALRGNGKGLRDRLPKLSRPGASPSPSPSTP
jgi:uncharacterized protein DUF5666